MRYVAAAMLISLAGENVTAEKIREILGSVGVDCDDAKMKLVVEQLAGKNMEDVLEAGRGKLASMGGAAVAASSSSAAAEEVPKEEKREENVESEDSDEDMGFGLFD